MTTYYKDTTANGSAVSKRHRCNEVKQEEVFNSKMTTSEKLFTMVADLELDENDLELLDADGINGIFDDDLQAEDAKAAHFKAQATAVLFA